MPIEQFEEKMTLVKKNQPKYKIFRVRKYIRKCRPRFYSPPPPSNIIKTKHILTWHFPSISEQTNAACASAFRDNHRFQTWQLSPNDPGKTNSRHTIWTMHDKINSSPPNAAYMRRRIGSASIQTVVCRLLGGKPLSKEMLDYCQLNP